MIKQDDVRTWPFIPIIMFLTEEGQGPANLDEIGEITWEVWSHNCEYTFRPFTHLADAINKAIELSSPYFGLNSEEVTKLWESKQSEYRNNP